MKMSIVSTIIIPMLMVELNLANSQSVDCSISSDDCLLFLASNFTKDCNAGRLANYAECLSNDNCLSSATANVQLNLQYCREGGCIISCVDGDPLTCTFMCQKPTGDENIDKRQTNIFQICTDCLKFKFISGGTSSTNAMSSVVIATAAVAISTFM